MMQKGPQKGFTLLEVLISILIVTFLITAVFAATSGIARLVKTEKQVTSKNQQVISFFEIFRKDLRGWLPAKKIARRPVPIQQPGHYFELLSFATTADALILPDLDKQPSLPRATPKVRYVVSPSARGFDLHRQQWGAHGPMASLHVFTFTEEPKIEYSDGENWSTTLRDTQRPVAIRLKSGDLTWHFVL